jgi:hypothetical protein
MKYGIKRLDPFEDHGSFSHLVGDHISWFEREKFLDFLRGGDLCGAMAFLSHRSCFTFHLCHRCSTLSFASVTT